MRSSHFRQWGTSSMLYLLLLAWPYHLDFKTSPKGKSSANSISPTLAAKGCLPTAPSLMMRLTGKAIIQLSQGLIGALPPWQYYNIHPRLLLATNWSLDSVQRCLLCISLHRIRRMSQTYPQSSGVIYPIRSYCQWVHVMQLPLPDGSDAFRVITAQLQVPTNVPPHISAYFCKHDVECYLETRQ